MLYCMVVVLCECCVFDELGNVQSFVYRLCCHFAYSFKLIDRKIHSLVKSPQKLKLEDTFWTLFNLMSLDSIHM